MKAKIMKALERHGITTETIRKAKRTFIQAAIGVIAANIPFIDFSSSKEVLKSALISLLATAIAAGLAAVMNKEKTNGGAEG